MNEFQRHTGFTVISGGQTGVDLAALRAAQCLGYKTGGYAPKGFKTQVGRQLGLGPNFGLIEHQGGYSARTRANVEQADATLVIAADIQSAGTALTIAACEVFSKPILTIEVAKAENPIMPLPLLSSEQVSNAVDWIVGMLEAAIKDRGMFMLNVAGNSNTSAPGIFTPAFIGLLQILHRVQLVVCEKHGFAHDDRVTWIANKLTDSNVVKALDNNFNAYPDLNPRHQGLLIVDLE
jgi:hypothetical protein